MRKIKHLVVHTSATSQETTIEEIQKYWKNNLKWKNPGYHFMIKPNGETVNLLPIERVSNGVAGHNANIINICYIGGVDSNNRAVDNRTDEQKSSLLKLLKKLKAQFPSATIKGHRDFSPDLNKNGIIEPFEFIKQCPCFNAMDEYKNL